ncbi:retrovirus-related pol polyprotein from transposon TNT 1-94 [Tanacetum coccineum]|uniref:Retrovirus-related pol polyprotein from transposon TNT 1-94 n=1 Tax=Tanacetum coccineum TaxID=301880 RepID=A0ABQ5GWP5_9ASTR
MTLYNALPRKEYEQVFMCKTAKEVWHTLIITHQGNSQVKNCKIDLLTQQYDKFSSQVKKLLIAASLDSMLLAKVTAIEEAKYLDILPLDELIDNLKVYEMILTCDGFASKPIKEKVMPIALKVNVNRGQTSSYSICQDESDEDEEINLMAKNFRKLFRKGVKKHDKLNICKENTNSGESSRRERGCYNCGNKNHFIDDCPKPRKNKAFVGGSWSDSEDGNEPQNDATCLMDIDSQKVWHERDFQTYHQIMDSCCTNHTAVNRKLFNLYSLNQDEHIIPKNGVFNLDRTQNPNCDLEEVLPKVENIKEIRYHPIDQVIGKLDEKTLRSRAQDKSKFFAFVSTIEPKNIKEAIKDESWTMAIQEELDQFVRNDVWDLVPCPLDHTVIGTK